MALNLPMDLLNEVLTLLLTSPGEESEVEVVEPAHMGDHADSPEKKKTKIHTTPAIRGGWYSAGGGTPIYQYGLSTTL